MFPFRTRRFITAASIAGLAAAGGITVAIASDHQDSPDVELNPTHDMTDFYAFPAATAGRIALVLNSRAFLTPAQSPTASFDRNLLYQIKVDNTGDGIEDKVFQVVFKGTGVDQQVEVRGPIAPPVAGAMRNELSTAAATIAGRINTNLGSAPGIQVFAGPRDDPFFLDLEQFFRIIPDRKPAAGPLSQLPSTPSASAFRPVGQAQNYLAGFNVLSIVIELPVADLTAGGTNKLGLWGTISR